MSARDGLLRHLTGQSLCPPPRPVEEATGLLDAYRAEVLREAAAAVAAFTGNQLDANAKLLRRMADGGKDIPAGDESTRATGLVTCEVCTKEYTPGQPCPVCEDESHLDTAPDFFRPGRTYTTSHNHAFRCEHVTTHPDSGEQRAVGWYSRNGRWHRVASLDPDDWSHGRWTEVTEAGESRA